MTTQTKNINVLIMNCVLDSIDEPIYKRYRNQSSSFLGNVL
jgi:hypothetical protein